MQPSSDGGVLVPFLFFKLGRIYLTNREKEIIWNKKDVMALEWKMEKIR